jgi:hypothetical protein
LSDSSKQILAVGEHGRLLISDDNGDSWYPGNSGTTNDLESISPVNRGEKFYIVGVSGSFVKYTMGSQRFEIGDIVLDHLLSNVHVHIALPGLQTIPPPQFRIRAVRSSELNRVAPVDLPTQVTPPEEGENQWKSSFDLSSLSPQPGESFNLQLCFSQGTFSRCIPLPQLTVVPWIDFNKNKKWIVPLGVMAFALVFLTVLLIVRPLRILTLYRKAVIYDLIEKSSIPGAGIVKLLLSLTLLPTFAFHRRTLDAWIDEHRDAFRNRWNKDLAAAAIIQSSSAYVPLPVEFQSVTTNYLVMEPSAENLGRLLAGPNAITIVGPGGIGKTTLLRQFAGWLFDSAYTRSTFLRCAVPISIESYSGTLKEYLRRKLESITGQEVSPEFLCHLLIKLRLALFVDSFSELPPGVQQQMIRGFEESSVMSLVISSRSQIDIRWVGKVGLFPKPLDSRTLLYFITALLSQLTVEKSHLNTMELQLELGGKIVRVMKTGGGEIPLTPLLVTLYLNRAIDLLSVGKSLDELPASVAEMYFDYIRLLLRSTAEISTEEMLAAVKAIAKMSLGERFVPAKFSFEAALRSIEFGPAASKDSVLRALITAGILIQEELGLGNSLQFVFDPLAEFCAAYAYAEEIGHDVERWGSFMNRLGDAGPAASGFRTAVAMIAETYGPKGLCPTEAPIATD